MFGWQAAKQAVEAEGIYIGGWDPRYVLLPKRSDRHDGQSTAKSTVKLSD